VREAFDEVDALVEALKKRADEVLHMVGRELDRPRDPDQDPDADDGSALATAAKGAAALLVTKAATNAATSAASNAAGSAARHAKAAAEDVSRKATKRAAKKARSKKASRKAAKKAKKAAKALSKRAATGASGAADLGGRVTSKAFDAASELAERAPEALHLPKSERRASKSRAPLVFIVTGAVTVVAVVIWRRWQATKELRAVDNTAPDEFGAMVERAELAGTPPAT